jgi:hypothetical protein
MPKHLGYLRFSAYREGVWDRELQLRTPSGPRAGPASVALILHHRFRKKGCANDRLKVVRSLLGVFLFPGDVVVRADIKMWSVRSANRFIEHINHGLLQTSRKARFPIRPVVVVRQFGDYKSRRPYFYLQSRVNISCHGLTSKRVERVSWPGRIDRSYTAMARSRSRPKPTARSREQLPCATTAAAISSSSTPRRSIA